MALELLEQPALALDALAGRVHQLQIDELLRFTSNQQADWKFVAAPHIANELADLLANVLGLLSVQPSDWIQRLADGDEAGGREDNEQGGDVIRHVFRFVNGLIYFKIAQQFSRHDAGSLRQCEIESIRAQ